MKTMILLLVLALLVPVPISQAQPTPVECPLPPFQLPLQAPARSEIDESGALVVDGTPVELPDGLTVRQQIWSDDGEVLLISATSPEFDSRVFVYGDGELTELLGADDLLALRDEEFKDAVTLYDVTFIPGTHTVLFNTEVLIGDPGGIFVEHPLDLWSLNLDSGELNEIYPYDEGGKFHIAPDGQSVVLMNVDRIWQADINGSNERTIFEGVVGMGLGHGYSHPPLAWDIAADIPTIRVLLFPSYDPNTTSAEVPFEIREFVLGDEIEERTLLEGPVVFFPTVELSPDGMRAANWWWSNENSAEAFDVTVYQPDAEPLVLDSFEIANQGGSAFIHWDDETHLTYGHIDEANTVVSRRADLCGEITELEPYQSSMAEILSR